MADETRKQFRLQELLDKDHAGELTDAEYEELQRLKNALGYRQDIEDVRNDAMKLPEYTHHKPYGGKSDLGEGVYGPTWVDRPDNPDDHE
jgi:hypothetical protein